MKSLFKRIGLIGVMLLNLFFPFSSKGQTIVGGAITTSTTWIKINSPYLVQSNVTVGAGIILTIEPGVRVKFSFNKGLEINGGKLIATGTILDSIIFESVAPSLFSPTWEGLSLTGWEQVLFEYCKFDNANTAIFSNISGASVTTIRHCSFTNNGTCLGTTLLYNDGLVDSSEFISNDNCIQYESPLYINHSFFNKNFLAIQGYDNLKVENCEIDSTGDIGILLNYGDTLLNCILKHNNTAIYTSGGLITGNIIDSNQVGLRIDCGLPIVNCNMICNNSTYAAIYLCPYYACSIANNYWCGISGVSIPTIINDGFDTPGIDYLNFLPVDNSQCYLTLITDEVQQSDYFSVYPNPGSTEITISTLSTQDLIISDLTGKKLKTIKFGGVNSEFRLDISDLKVGLYIIHQGSIYSKFMKN